MSEQKPSDWGDRNEKDEKVESKDEKDEKEMSKHEEKTVDEKWRRDPVNAVVWAAILIWAGLVFLAENLNLLPNLPTITFTDQDVMFSQPEAFAFIFLGAGLILLAGVLVRILVPTYRRPLGGSVFLGFIFIGIGLGNMFGWELVGPLVLIALGLSIILRRYLR
jgi:hypothetical protein